MKRDIDNAPETGTFFAGEQDIPYRVVRSKKRRRTVGLSIDSGATLRISVPFRASARDIQSILQSRATWIAKHVGEVKKRQARPERQFTDGATVLYLGYPCRLRITRDETTPQGIRLKPRRMDVNIHGDWLSEASLQQEVKLEIMLWLKSRAKTKLQRRTDLWSEKLGLRYQKLIVSNPKKRWGSCSADDVIRLNWKLIMAPLPLLDYVVAHELCHVPHKNHGVRFWRRLATVMPDYQARRDRLRKMTHHLTL